MTIVLGPADVRAILDPRTAIELVEGACLDLAAGAAQNPLRRGMLLARRPGSLGRPSDSGPRAQRGVLGLMPGALSGSAGHPPALGVKVVSVMPWNDRTPFDAHQGVVVLLDPATGVPDALLDASEITALRTAAASAVATRALAREDARSLALIGTGVEARAHLAALALVRPFERVRVFSRDPAARAAFASRETRPELEVVAAASAEEAVRGADVVCTLTTSLEPVLLGDWLEPGVHVNAVGACLPKARELDALAVSRARLFADSREGLFAEAGDFLLARAEGVVGDEHVVGELGEVLAGRVPGRRSRDEITLFESLGLAAWDLAVGEWVAREARSRGLGTEVAFGGLRHA